MSKSNSILAAFRGLPGDELDKACNKIFKRHKGTFVGAGTNLFNSERDVQYDVPQNNAASCVVALKRAGIKAQVLRG